MRVSSHVRPCFTPRAFPSKLGRRQLKHQTCRPDTPLLDLHHAGLREVNLPFQLPRIGLCFLLACTWPLEQQVLVNKQHPAPLLIDYPLHAMPTPILSYTHVDKTETLHNTATNYRNSCKQHTDQAWRSLDSQFRPGISPVCPPCRTWRDHAHRCTKMMRAMGKITLTSAPRNALKSSSLMLELLQNRMSKYGTLSNSQ